MVPNFYNGTSADHASIAFARFTAGLHLAGISPVRKRHGWPRQAEVHRTRSGRRRRPICLAA